MQKALQRASAGMPAECKCCLASRAQRLHFLVLVDRRLELITPSSVVRVSIRPSASTQFLTRAMPL
jgi:hypothetical protein